MFMRIFGIILIVIGALMLIFNGINYQTEKRVADIGPIKINKRENNHVQWPGYAGGFIIVAGIVLVVVGRKKD